MKWLHILAGLLALASGAVAMSAGKGGLGRLMDARMLLAGSIQGAHRLARHLWRMSFAMWIAAGSFFLGQAKFFPEPIRKSGLLAVPVVFVLGFLVYWLVRVLRKRRNPVAAQVTVAPRISKHTSADRIPSATRVVS